MGELVLIPTFNQCKIKLADGVVGTLKQDSCLVVCGGRAQQLRS